jgi:hypothetical protein
MANETMPPTTPIAAGIGWRWWRRDPVTGLLGSPYGYRKAMPDVVPGGQWIAATCPHRGLSVVETIVAQKRLAETFWHPDFEGVPGPVCVCGWHVIPDLDAAWHYGRSVFRIIWPQPDEMRLYRVEYAGPVIIGEQHGPRPTLRAAWVRVVCEESE